MPVTALVLRNYGCEKSRLAAVALSQALYDRKYGMAEVDPNNSDEFPKGKDQNNVDRWVPLIQQRIDEADYVIVMLSTQLNHAEPDGSHGVGLRY